MHSACSLFVNLKESHRRGKERAVAPHSFLCLPNNTNSQKTSSSQIVPQNMIPPMPPRVSLVSSSFDRGDDAEASKQQPQSVEVILEKEDQHVPLSHSPTSKQMKRSRRPSSSILQSRDSIVSTSSTLSSSSHHGMGGANTSSHHRRRSSVSFDGATEVIEFLKLNEGDRENVWYNKKELSEIKQECRRLAQQASEASIEVEEGETQRGLEHLMISTSTGREGRSSSSSPRRPSNRKHCRDVVFSEHANQILEYGYICDDERLALEYKMAAESSKRVALERGYLDAETAWGDEDASSSSSSSYQEAHC